MRKLIKNNLKVFVAIIITVVICISSSVYATIRIQASEIEYNGTPVDQVLDDLYSKSSGGIKLCKFVDDTYGAQGNVGSKYECKLGDGETRYFYILTVNNDNTVDLIMDSNLLENDQEILLSWNQAGNYFLTGEGANYYNIWKNVATIKITSAATVIKVIGFTNWNKSSGFCLEGNSVYINWSSSELCPSVANPKYVWLYGNYWLSDLQSSSWGWAMNTGGSSSARNITTDAVAPIRPVITVFKSSLY